MTQNRDSLDLRRGCAFTLPEVLVVIVILAVLAVLAIPKFANALQHARLDAAANRIVHDVAFARRAARSAGAAATLTVNASAHSYVISGAAVLKSQSSQHHVRLNGDEYATRIVAFDFGGETSIVFDAYGAPSANGMIVLRSGDAHRTIIIDKATGAAVARVGTPSDLGLSPPTTMTEEAVEDK